jgi:proline iminopeptidase
MRLMYAQLSDTRLFFDVDGTKLRPDGPRMREVPTLLLLHGGPGFDHSVFKPVFSALAEVAQIVYLDQRGQGCSDPVAQVTITQCADDVVTFCAAVGIEKPVVLGYSFGGMVAMSYAARYPDHPSKLILLSTSAHRILDRILSAFERLGGSEPVEVARQFFADPCDRTLNNYLATCLPHYYQTRQDPDAMARTLFKRRMALDFFTKEYARIDLRPMLPHIRCRTLVIAGDQDPITPLDDARDIARAIDSGLVTLKTFPGCGHGVFPDNPVAAIAGSRESIT